jgi:hypothetical protein
VTETVCPKCRARSGDDWSQCKGMCPMVGSPHFDPTWALGECDPDLQPKPSNDRDLQAAVDSLTNWLLDNTDDDQGFEVIPEIDEARTLIMDFLEGRSA